MNRSRPRRSDPLLPLAAAPLLLAALAPMLGACVNPVVDEPPRGPLAQAFHDASVETGVPEEILLAVGFVETRWRTPPADDAHGHDHAMGRAGLMGVADRDDRPVLRETAVALGVDPEKARTSGPLNVRVAAHALAAIAKKGGDGTLPDTLRGWRGALARYGAGDDDVAGPAYAVSVLEVVEAGATGEGDLGEKLTLRGTGKVGAGAEPAASTSKAQALDYEGVAQWIPAREGFFQYGRSSPITHVIIHTTEGSYWSAINWFRDPSNPWFTSAHYVIRSSDGQITQMVRERDTAHHIGGWNPWSIGIEHEAKAGEGYLWFTDEMLRASAALTRSICLRYGIPMDRQHIVGHVEVPGASHWDPGPYFPWDYYMQLVRDPNTLPGAPVGGCDGLDYAGACDGQTLRWCEAGAIKEVDCAARGKSCGFQDQQIGHNCLDAPPPPQGFCATHEGTWCDGGDVVTCDGGAEASRTTCAYGCKTMPPGVPDECEAPPQGFCATHEGTWCDGGDVVTCDGGAEVSRTSCEHGCKTMPPGVPDACEAPPADPCGGLDYAGECQGTLLRWCEAGALREHDCGGQGEVCGYASDEVGYDCVAAPVDPCQGLDYLGECSGSTLRWCEDGALREVSCSARGQSCGWQSASVGYNCL